MPHFQNPLQKKIAALVALLNALKPLISIGEKIKLLDEFSTTKSYLKKHPKMKEILSQASPEETLFIKSVLAIEQGPVVFREYPQEIHDPAWQQIFVILRNLERHYSSIGGIIGYHVAVLKRIVGHSEPPEEHQKVNYLHPVGIDISHYTSDVKSFVKAGILSMGQFAEMYAVGGAGDRLNLLDEQSGEALPAAQLLFTGFTLLEGLIRDLQAKEYLFYKLTGKQVITPIAMMTSYEKDNHERIVSLCEKNHWFGRKKEEFYFFIQPQVPMVTVQGDWVMKDQMQVVVKPGGHGMIWKLAQDENVFDKLLAEGRRYVLVRQINNPIAGIDYGLLAFLGYGYSHQKLFGFSSCPRRLNTSEGMDVLLERVKKDGVEYCITNVEYTVFEQHGLKDQPSEAGGEHSLFPANTNILFADLRVIQRAIPNVPIPGMMINMKNKVCHTNAEGEKEEIQAGRLESTMQNIADYIADHYSNNLPEITPEDLRSYITYNDRLKTISVAKKSYLPGGSLLETPEGCFYDLLLNYHQLLKEYCGIELEPFPKQQDYLQNPSFLFYFHPALGPLYQIIQQKVQGGKFYAGAECVLEIAELEIKNLHLQGSLHILSECFLGKKDEEGTIRYSEESGKCRLLNVTVKNKGVNYQHPDNQYWKHQIHRHECMKIVLHGNAEFFAENVTFNGSHQIEVPDGHRMIALEKKGKVVFQLEKIAAPTWFWTYNFDHEDNIVLEVTTRAK